MIMIMIIMKMKIMKMKMSIHLKYYQKKFYEFKKIILLIKQNHSFKIMVLLLYHQLINIYKY